MNTERNIFETPDTAEPSDKYASTPEVAPGSESSYAGQSVAEKTEDEAKEELSIDGAAYNALTKPDPHEATTFNPSEAQGKWPSDFLKLDKERYFEMLVEIHQGKQNGPVYEHSEYHTYQLRTDIVEMVATNLNLTENQERRAIARATNVDAEKFGKKLELIAFCSCAYVVHRDDMGYAEDRHFHPNKDETDKLFLEVADQFGLREDEINRVCRQFDQLFNDQVPPEDFDKRKPGMEPNTHPNGTIMKSSLTSEEQKGIPTRGGI